MYKVLYENYRKQEKKRQGFDTLRLGSNGQAGAANLLDS